MFWTLSIGKNVFCQNAFFGLKLFSRLKCAQANLYTFTKEIYRFACAHFIMLLLFFSWKTCFHLWHRDKYVVGDDYLPSWEVPSFTKYMDDKAGFSFRDTLNAYITHSMKMDPNKMWNEIYSTIVEVYQNTEVHFAKVLLNVQYGVS